MSDRPERIIASETGLQKALGYVNHLHADRCETHVDIEAKHTNRSDMLHGGIHAILLDSACGFAASRALSDDGNQLIVTLSLTTNYLAAAKEGRVTATGRVTHAGRSIVYAAGEVRHENGDLLATGSGVFKRVG
ncbi:MAG: PaaI family thioesterase [Ahrensia sp.]|nr:PaaI family thioesterase [Ahrensia sp.]